MHYQRQQRGWVEYSDWERRWLGDCSWKKGEGGGDGIQSHHFFLGRKENHEQWIRTWKSLSHVQLLAIQSIILQARNVEWVAIPFSRGSSQSRNRTRSPVLQADSLPAEPPGKPKNIGVGSLYLLQWVFRTQESNCSLLHWRQILYRLSHQGREIRSIISGGTKDHSLVIFILLGALR